MRDFALVVLVALVFTYACFEHGGATSREWGFCLLGVTACGLLAWPRFAPALHPALLCGIVFVVLYVGFQMLPLPIALLRWIDPTRAELLTAINTFEHLSGKHEATSAPLSVAPSITFAHLQRLVSYILIFFIARELSWRMAGRQWTLAIPVLLVGTLEATLGLAQYFSGAARASGTYVNPDHFAALLRMTLPFPVMLAVRLVQRRASRYGRSTLDIASVCLLMLCSGVILLGVLYSLSRVSMAIVLVSGCIAAALAWRRNNRLSTTIFVAGVAAALAFFLFSAAPSRLANRFSPNSGTKSVTADARLRFWRETTRMIDAYPVFGVGLGAYGSAIQKFRDSPPLGLLEFAHNDYLQVVAELGAAGAIPLLLCAGWIFSMPWRAALSGVESKNRLLAAACASALAAAALDSLVDFGFYVPANMLVAGWIAGIGSCLNFGRQRAITAEPSIYRGPER